MRETVGLTCCCWSSLRVCSCCWSFWSRWASSFSSEPRPVCRSWIWVSKPLWWVRLAASSSWATLSFSSDACGERKQQGHGSESSTCIHILTVIHLWLVQSSTHSNSFLIQHFYLTTWTPQPTGGLERHVVFLLNQLIKYVIDHNQTLWKQELLSIFKFHNVLEQIMSQMHQFWKEE